MSGKRRPTTDQRRKAAQSYPHGGGANDSCMAVAAPVLVGIGTLAALLVRGLR